MKKIKVLYVEAERPAREISIEPSLENLQKLVGGLIEIVYYFDDVILICNEEGKINNLPLNRAIYRNGHLVDVIAGNFLICDADDDEIAGLPEEKMKKYLDVFGSPEFFLPTKRGLVVIK